MQDRSALVLLGLLAAAASGAALPEESACAGDDGSCGDGISLIQKDVQLKHATAHQAEATKVMVQVPPRYMWGWTPPAPPGAVGFCGSTSVQSSALYYGNWLSLEKVRATSGGVSEKHQLLLGTAGDVGDQAVSHACGLLKLKCSDWNYYAADASSATYLNWVRGKLRAKYPVIIGVYQKGHPSNDYDHIVPAVGYDNEGAGGLYYNDLKYLVSRRGDLSRFIMTRSQCDAATTDPSVPVDPTGDFRFCLPRDVNYATAVEGNADDNGELHPLRLLADSDREPDYSKEDKIGAQPRMMKGTLVAKGLKPGSAYVLLRYDDPSKVPTSGFLSAPAAERTAIPAGFVSWRKEVSFWSKSTTFFRLVEQK